MSFRFRKPNLFLIGAPKCGTTSLYGWLSQHQEVYAPKVKEPHFFYNPYGRYLSEEEYLDLFAAEEEFSYFLDGSVWYLFSRVAVSRILKSCESPKFIVCLRNPLEMAPSLHHQKIFTGHETVRDFDEAWDLSDDRSCGSFSGITNLPVSADPRHMSYRDACLLGEQISYLLENVDQDQVFFCFMDDFIDDARSSLDAVCAFLDVPVDSSISTTPSNRAKRWRSESLRKVLDGGAKIKRSMGLTSRSGLFSRLHDANRVESAWPKPSGRVMEEMRSVYRSDIQLLSDLTKRDLSHWNS